MEYTANCWFSTRGQTLTLEHHGGSSRQGYVLPPGPESIPVKDIRAREYKPIVARVDRILAAKQWDDGADVSGLEREIDQLVDALYGLTPEEIRIVGAAK
jgi:hypothetical protein